MKDRMLLDGTTARATQRVTSAWNATTRTRPVLSAAGRPKGKGKVIDSFG